MGNSAYFEERRKYPRYSIKLPLEYWQTDDAYRGGMVGNVSETGLLIRSIQDLPVNEELNARVFFPNGYEFDGIRVVARIVWKEPYCETDWKGFKYGLEFVRISEEDHRKLVDLLWSPSTLEEISIREDAALTKPQPEKTKSSPLSSLDLYPRNETRRSCLWERLKTNIFTFKIRSNNLSQ